MDYSVVGKYFISMIKQYETIYRRFSWLKTTEHCEGFYQNYSFPSPPAMIYIDKVHFNHLRLFGCQINLNSLTQ